MQIEINEYIALIFIQCLAYVILCDVSVHVSVCVCEWNHISEHDWLFTALLRNASDMVYYGEKVNTVTAVSFSLTWRLKQHQHQQL